MSCEQVSPDEIRRNEFSRQVTRRIRATEAATGKRPVPIIAMTAYAMEGDRERLLEKGMDGYVAKPFSMKELMSVIKESEV